jgi:hypothetical protein
MFEHLQKRSKVNGWRMLINVMISALDGNICVFVDRRPIAFPAMNVLIKESTVCFFSLVCSLDF